MPIFEIDEELLNVIPEDAKAKLKPFQPEDVSGLKEKATALLKEKKTLEQQLADLKNQSPNVGEGGDAKLKAMLEDSERQRQDLLGQVEAAKRQGSEILLKTEAEKLAMATSDPKKRQMLADIYRRRIDLDGGSVVVLDEKGNATISSLSDLENSIKAEYPFLFDGSRASGGGATGNTGGAGVSQKTIKRSAFNAMSNAEKLKFMTEGGALTD